MGGREENGQKIEEEVQQDSKKVVSRQSVRNLIGSSKRIKRQTRKTQITMKCKREDRQKKKIHK